MEIEKVMDFELEIFEVEEATVMEEMGASIFIIACCSSIEIKPY
ncbi:MULTISPECIES: hypothetical protein [Sutcliffiella]|nr:MULTISPECIES: hypothetical protein [Sutcliffiella]WBL16832.1 hypothetical protein O1A01_09425 [Sutcliffiella sp. NC1]